MDWEVLYYNAKVQATVRAKGKEGIGRAFFCMIVDQRIVILHSFIKKTQKTPQKELKIARRRMADVQENW